MNKIIEVSNLRKSYGNIEAVKDISFYVESGKLFAFLGPNGAGKSTTIDIICTFLTPDSGSIIVDNHVLGKEDEKIRGKIGVVFQDNLLDNLLTVEENLRVRGSFYGLSGKALDMAIEKAVMSTGVTEFLKRRYGKLSGGQRRRADIARALLHTPKILFLDEPTTGLDPQTRKSVWETIKNLQKETGMTVFLTTHYMEEAEDADYVIVIDNGQIAAKGTPTELKQRYSKDMLKLYLNSPYNIDKVLEILNNEQYSFTTLNDKIEVQIESSLESLPLLEQCKHLIDGFEVVYGSMDDAFIGITGKEIRE